MSLDIECCHGWPGIAYRLGCNRQRRVAKITHGRPQAENGALVNTNKRDEEEMDVRDRHEKTTNLRG